MLSRIIREKLPKENYYLAGDRLFFGIVSRIEKMPSFRFLYLRVYIEEYKAVDLSLEDLPTLTTGISGCEREEELSFVMWRRGDEDIKKILRAVKRKKLFEKRAKGAEEEIFLSFLLPEEQESVRAVVCFALGDRSYVVEEWEVDGWGLHSARAVSANLTSHALSTPIQAALIDLERGGEGFLLKRLDKCLQGNVERLYKKLNRSIARAVEDRITGEGLFGLAAICRYREAIQKTLFEGGENERKRKNKRANRKPSGRAGKKD